MDQAELYHRQFAGGFFLLGRSESDGRLSRDTNGVELAAAGQNSLFYRSFPCPEQRLGFPIIASGWRALFSRCGLRLANTVPPVGIPI
jgi:hypothetical protein